MRACSLAVTVGSAGIQQVRFGDFQREVVLRQRTISYNELTPRPVTDADGQAVPYKPGRLKPQRAEIVRLLAPYVSVRFWTQVRAVVPLAAYLTLFQLSWCCARGCRTNWSSSPACWG